MHGSHLRDSGLRTFAKTSGISRIYSRQGRQSLGPYRFQWGTRMLGISYGPTENVEIQENRQSWWPSCNKVVKILNSRCFRSGNAFYDLFFI